FRIRSPAVAAVVGACVFTGLVSPILYRAAVVEPVALQWKNQPDSFAACFGFLSLLCYLWARAERRGALGAAVVAYLAACGFKEIAVPLPLICAALEMGAPIRTRRGAGWRVGAMVGAGAAFLAARYLAIHGMGYTYGLNH